VIIVEIDRGGKQSIRKLAQLINGAKSSVHRYLHAQKLRNRSPWMKRFPAAFDF
jgi:hypothetical protein